jgi:TRAP-type uncharacterized transport system substrate-binding protein
VRLEFRATRGGVENLALLREAGSSVSIAVAQGGLTSAVDSPGIESLGAMFREPVWLFEPGEGALRPGGRSLRGRVFIDQPGSGTRALADVLLPAIGLDVSGTERVDMTAAEAGDALLRGEFELMMTVNAWEAPLAYGSIMQLRIFRLYGELKFLEAELDAAKGAEPMQRLARQPGDLEQRANHLHVPEMYADRLYTLRLHINLVRSRLNGGRQPSGG